MGKRRSVGSRQWEVESIVSSKYDEEDGEMLYEIKWKGYKETTWEPEESLENCPLVLQGLQKFQKNLRNKNFVLNWILNESELSGV